MTDTAAAPGPPPLFTIRSRGRMIPARREPRHAAQRCHRPDAPEKWAFSRPAMNAKRPDGGCRPGAAIYVTMERIGFEPMTFRLQSGCSPS